MCFIFGKQQNKTKKWQCGPGTVGPASSQASTGNLLKMQNKQIYRLSPQIYWVRNSVFDASNLWSTRLSGWLLYPLKFANHWHKHKEDGEKYFVLYTPYELIPGEVLSMTEDRLSIIIFTLSEKIKSQESRDLV